MRILQLCIKPPYPAVDGGTLAMNSITQGLLGTGCEVKVLTVESDKHRLQRELLPADYVERTAIESVYVDLGVKPLPAAVAMLCGESYHVKRYISEEFGQRLCQVLDNGEFDVVHVESIFLAPYVPMIRRHSNAKIVLRAHNVEHMIWRRVADHVHNPLKRNYMKHLALTLRAYELEHINAFDGVVCIAATDADYFKRNGCRRPLVSIPFGIEVEECVSAEVEPYSLFHIGAMDWIPNLEGIDWFLNQVWPLVHRQVPQAHLYLAGRKMPSRMLNAKVEGVTMVGEVDDAMHFIGSKQINVVPLLSGSGIRVKIIEAMSVGKTVITTTLGAQGIEAADGEHLLIADTPEAFAQQIGRCVADQELCQRIGRNAERLVAEHYDVKLLTDRLITFYNRILGTNNNDDK